MIVDVHSHVAPFGLPDFAERHGDARWPVFRVEEGVGRLWQNGVEVRSLPEQAWSVTRRIEHMDEIGCDLHVVSPVPPLMVEWAPTSLAAQFCERVNEQVAVMVSERPERLAGVAIAPLADGERAARVLEQAADAGLRGVQIATRAGNLELDDPSLQPFFETAERLDMPVFVHPLLQGDTSSWSPGFRGFPLSFGLNMGTDTALAAAALILGGVTLRFPSLRVCFAHGGGGFIWSAPRLANAWDASHDRPLSELMANVYVDTVVYDPENVRYLVSRLGPERVIWGTDYPLPAQAEQRREILAPLTPEQAAWVAGGTAASLLGLPTDPALSEGPRQPAS